MDDKQSKLEQPVSPAHDTDGVEPDHPPVGTIFVLLGIITVGVAVAGLGLWEVFNMTARQSTLERDLALPNAELGELRARDQGALSQYAEVDRDAGLYRIPVDRAMRLLIARPGLIAAAAAPAGSAALDSDAGVAVEGGASETTGAGDASAGIDARSEAPNTPDASYR